jgi:glycosyltransferase involved in cell wall biosynthesis
MDILFVTDLFYPYIGGGEILIKNLAEGLSEKGHNCTIITSRLLGTEKEETKNNVKIKRVNVPIGRYSFSATGGLKGILEDFDVIHTQTFVSAGAAWLIKNIKKKPCVITVHLLEKRMWYAHFGFIRGVLNEFLEQRILHRDFDFWVPVSLYTRNFLRYEGIPDEKMGVIYNGVDHDLFNPKVDGKRIRKTLGLNDKKFIFFYGRPAPEKGFDYFIESAKSLMKKYDDVVFGAMLPYQNMHEKYIRLLEKVFGSMVHSDIDIEGKIITTKKRNFFIIPPRSQEFVPEVVASSDIVVIPSVSEGFGLTTLEACSLGKPVIATNVGAIPEIIIDKQTGILVNPKKPNEITEAVCHLLKNESEAKRIGKNAAERSRMFDWEKTVSQYLEIFEELVE